MKTYEVLEVCGKKVYKHISDDGWDRELFECGRYTLENHGGGFTAKDGYGCNYANDIGNSTLEITIKNLIDKGRL